MILYAYEVKKTNEYHSQQLLQAAEKELTKVISTPTYTSSSSNSSNNVQHYQYFSGSGY